MIMSSGYWNIGIFKRIPLLKEKLNTSFYALENTKKQWNLLLGRAQKNWNAILYSRWDELILTFFSRKEIIQWQRDSV